MADGDGTARRTNRRGNATRENMLKTAVKALATGDPGAVSANKIAREIGATWGAVKYQFGDNDGLWAAVLQYTAERRAEGLSFADTTAPLRQRVADIIDTLYEGLTSTDSRAIENLRAALPRDHAELEQPSPHRRRTVVVGARLARDAKRLADLDVDPDRVQGRGPHSWCHAGHHVRTAAGHAFDLDMARQGLDQRHRRLPRGEPGPSASRALDRDAQVDSPSSSPHRRSNRKPSAPAGVLAWRPRP
jgi:AcrR family transcriptional regulator